MKKLFKVCLFLIVLTTFAQSESIQHSPKLTYGTPEEVGMSTERLDKIDNMLKDAIEDGQIPGAIGLIVRNGKIVYHKAFGMADNEAGRKLDRNDIFRIASQTKAITSTAVMMLWEEGKFLLDDPISKYIPEFKNPQILVEVKDEDTTYTTKPAEDEITIRQLLSHTSGISYGLISPDERFRKIYPKAGIIDGFTTKDITIEENIKKLAKLPLNHNPGEEFVYSEGLDVLGYFIEIISGMPLDEFFRTRIFEPLEMNDTYFYLPESKYDRLVPVQERVDGKWIKYDHTFFDPDYPIKGAKKFFSGGAGLSSTVLDYAKFLQMYLNEGELNGIRLLSRTTVRIILENQIGDIWEGRGSYFGLAFNVTNKIGEAEGGRGSAGTFDWGGYFNTKYFGDPQEQLIGIIFKQTFGNSGDETSAKFRIMASAAIDD